jgi:hypothetical protein
MESTMSRGQLHPEERLQILRNLDTERNWYSLDDKRVCAVCDRVFSGRQIEIKMDCAGCYELKCPTPLCASHIGNWFLCELSPARYTRSARRPLKKAELSIFDPPSDILGAAATCWSSDW